MGSREVGSTSAGSISPVAAGTGTGTEVLQDRRAEDAGSGSGFGSEARSEAGGVVAPRRGRGLIGTGRSAGLHLGFRKRAASRIADLLAVLVYSSGMPVSPADYANRIFGSIVLAVMATAASAIAYLGQCAGLFPPYPLLPLPFLAAAAASSVWAAMMILRPLAALSARKRMCERELPFAATYLAMACASGISVASAFSRLKSFRSLPQFRLEAMRIEKVRRLYALHPYEAIIFEGKYHPADYVRDFYFSAVSAQKEGGGVFSVMKDETSKLFSLLQGRLKTASDKFSLIASAEMVSFIMVPMGLITVGVLFSGIIGVTAMALMCLALPTAISILMSYVIDAYTPKELTEPISLKGFLKALSAFPFAAGICVVSAVASFPIPFYYILGALIIIFMTPAAISYSSSRKRTKEILAALPSFARSIAEEVKKGSSPQMGIVNLSEGRTFNRSFDRLLHRMATHLKIGCQISRSAEMIETPWIAKVYFELLEHAELMGADPRSLDSLSDLVGNIYLSYRSLDSQTRFFTVMSYLNSLMLAFSTVITVDVVARLFAGIASAVSTVGLPLGMSLMSSGGLSSVATLAYSAVIYDAFLLGIIGGKASGGGSVVDGLRPAIICVLLALIGLLVFKEAGLVHALTGGGGGG